MHLAVILWRVLGTFICLRALLSDTMTNEPIRKLHDTTVKTPERFYEATTVEMYPNYLHIFTGREQHNTDNEVWVPADSSVEIGAEHSNSH